ncbi:MAG: hypothetical protein ACXWC9_00745 [Pseudobdellovibrionaceae bacterium]
MKNLLLILTCSVALGCTTIRMKYESTVKVDGQTNQFTYVNSYPVGGAHSSLCYITGIFLGGSCWYYLVMPTVQQKVMVIEEAQNHLNTKMAGKKFDEDFLRVSKVSFEDGAEETEFKPKVRAYTP